MGSIFRIFIVIFEIFEHFYVYMTRIGANIPSQVSTEIFVIGNH